jgi:hypothetical protein
MIVTVHWLDPIAVVWMAFRLVFDLSLAIRDGGVICGRLQEWRSDRDSDAVFAYLLVAIIRRTLTGDGYPIANGDKIFMIGRICVTRIPNEDTPRCE